MPKSPNGRRHRSSSSSSSSASSRSSVEEKRMSPGPKRRTRVDSPPAQKSSKHDRHPERRRRSRTPERRPRRRSRSRSPDRRRNDSGPSTSHRRDADNSPRRRDDRRRRSPTEVKKEVKDEPADEERREFRKPRAHPMKKVDSSQYEWGKADEAKEEEVEEEAVDKQEPTFELSGALATETNKVKGVVLKHTEPGDSAKTKTVWMWYVFSGDEFIEKMYLHRNSSYLIGRHPKLCDISMLHPSISTQHAVLQYRRVGGKVRPYIMDLGSSNGTTLNGTTIEPQRYYELKEQDVCKIGFSSRDYVLLNENSVKKDE